MVRWYIISMSYLSLTRDEGNKDKNKNVKHHFRLHIRLFLCYSKYKLDEIVKNSYVISSALTI